MSSSLVSSTDSLLLALKSAVNGDIIYVNPGYYSKINISNININGNVTIKSLESEKNTVFMDLDIKNSTGITFDNVKFSTEINVNSYSFIVSGSKGIAFNNVEIHGVGDVGAKVESAGLLIRESDNVTVVNSSVHSMRLGISLLNNTNVKIFNNFFHDLRTDGVRGGGNSHLTISNNLFTDFRPVAGDHPDAIQLWTVGTNTAATDIKINDNLIVRGKGSPIQGIFIQNSSTSDVTIRNITVSDNIVIGGMGNGVVVAADNAKVAGNTVLGIQGSKSWVSVKGKNSSVSDNVATSFLMGDAAIGGSRLANAIVDGGASAVASWLGQKTDFSGAWGDSAAVLKALAGGFAASSIAGAKAESAMIAVRGAAQSFFYVNGTGGADQLKTATNFDTRIIAGDGNDTLTGGVSGRNELIGGMGNDNYIVRNAGDKVIEATNSGNDTVWASIDYILPVNVEILRLQIGGLTGTGNNGDNRMLGSAGTDQLFGLAGDDLIQGNHGNDSLGGGSGDDILQGDGGNDILVGDAGNDILQGGSGSDALWGGVGADIFRFGLDSVERSSQDTIFDFARGSDRINLSQIDANISSNADDRFIFIDTRGFSKNAGELRYQVAGGDAYVSGDINGDGIADFIIIVANMNVITAADFIL